MPNSLPPGFLNLHPDPPFNFLLNRLASTNSPDELTELGRSIQTMEDCVRVLLDAAQRAEAEGRLLEAANFWRGAEFYIPAGEPGKSEAYERFRELHDKAKPELAARRQSVAFEGGELPVIELPAQSETRGTILANSGFDGLLEEMIPTLEPLAEAGYRVLGFEGPGQGAALRFSGLHMPHDWERPVAAILDHYNIDDCTLVGMSLGGYLAPRAAAFEPRVKRVVAWGAMYDFLGAVGRQLSPPKVAALQTLVRLGARKQVNAAIERVGKTNPLAKWATAHGIHVCGGKDAFDFIKWVMTMNLRKESHLITQDTLIVMGNQDHLVPLSQAYKQAEALKNARSVHVRIMTESEQGAQHCQIGNPMLVVDEILRWLDGLARRDADLENCRPNLLSERAA